MYWLTKPFWLQSISNIHHWRDMSELQQKISGKLPVHFYFTYSCFCVFSMYYLSYLFYPCSTIINHEILSSEFLHLWGSLLGFNCSFWFFLLKSSHRKFRLQCFYKNFITKRTEILRYALVKFWTWSDGERRCGRVVSSFFLEWKCWLVPRSDLVDHLTSSHYFSLCLNMNYLVRL